MGLGSGIVASCDGICRFGSDLALLWRRPAAAATIRPLAWKFPYAVAVTLKNKQKILFLSVTHVNVAERDIEPGVVTCAIS